MKATWEQIIDYANGVAEPEVRAIVESDSLALAEAQRISRIAGAREEAAPEIWVNRAKALMIPEMAKPTILEGVLAFLRPQMQPGFRSGNATALSATANLGDDRVEIQMRKLSEGGQMELIGVVESVSSKSIRVGTEEKWLANCDEDGQFIVRIAPTVRFLLFQVLETGETFKLEIRHED